MDISIIIPCYNHGLYIQDAIDSISVLKNIDYEVIIVNDGSSDEFTLNKLQDLQKEGYIVLSHENQGPAYTRNVGIKAASGKYILPLDADNRVKPEYIYKALIILEQGQYEIVYANPILFGDNTHERTLAGRDFNGNDLFFANYIDTCAIYKKEMWEDLGGYDSKIPRHGYEDWEFWLHAYTSEYRFYYINEPLFYYRVLANSVVAAISKEAHILNREYILKKHFKAFVQMVDHNYSHGKMYSHDMDYPLRSSFKYMYYFAHSIKNKLFKSSN